MRRVRGFTLVETVVVLALIALALGGGAQVLTQQVEHAREARAREDLVRIKQAVLTAYRDSGWALTPDDAPRITFASQQAANCTQQYQGTEVLAALAKSTPPRGDTPYCAPGDECWRGPYVVVQARARDGGFSDPWGQDVKLSYCYTSTDIPKPSAVLVSAGADRAFSTHDDIIEVLARAHLTGQLVAAPTATPQGDGGNVFNPVGPIWDVPDGTPFNDPCANGGCPPETPPRDPSVDPRTPTTDPPRDPTLDPRTPTTDPPGTDPRPTDPPRTDPPRTDPPRTDPPTDPPQDPTPTPDPTPPYSDPGGGSGGNGNSASDAGGCCGGEGAAGAAGSTGASCSDGSGGGGGGGGGCAASGTSSWAALVVGLGLLCSRRRAR